MKRLPSLKLTEKRVQGRESGGFKSDVRSTDASRVLFRLFEKGNDEEKGKRGESEVVGQDCKSSRGYYLLVFRKASSRRETRKRRDERERK